MGDNGKETEYSKSYYIMMGLMIFTGTCNTISLKLQNRLYDKILGYPFQHPWFQTIIMFIGELYCSFFWLCMRRKFQREEEIENEKKISDGKESTEQLPQASPFLFLVTMGCDLIGSTLLNFALLNMAGSVFQMLRGSMIIITCAFSIIFLSKYPKNYQWLGVGIVFLGVFLVGLSSQIFSSSSSESTNVFGIIMLLFSLMFQGFQFIYQEKILNKYKCHPMQIVAWEGIWGFISFIILLPIFEFIPCSESLKMICSINGNGELYLEATIFAFKQMFDKIPMFFLMIFQTFSVCGFNFFGIMLVKMSSSSTRAVMDNTRTILVWLFFIFVPMTNGETLESFVWLQLVGFIILLFGQVIYNSILKIPFLGFDKHFINKIEQDKNKYQDQQDFNENNQNTKNLLTNEL